MKNLCKFINASIVLLLFMSLIQKDAIEGGLKMH